MSLDASALTARSDFAIQLAREAGQIAMRYFRAGADTGTSLKGPQDFLTLADTKIDVLIRTALNAAFPDDTVLTEEAGGRSSIKCWVIDPIDGTANFARGLANFAISIAFCVDGVAELGIVFDPAADELFFARRGSGAWLNGKPLAIKAESTPETAAIDVGYARRTSAEAYLGVVGRLIVAGYDVMQFGSAARGLAHVAAGRLDGFYEAHLYAWDVLAGLLLVAESGGYVSDFAPGPAWEQGTSVLACSPALTASLQVAIGR